MDNNLLTDFLKKENSWTIKDSKLFRVIRTNNWSESISIVNLISYLANKDDHHPELFVSYTKIEISLFTHDLNNISERDIQLATKIESSLKI